MTVSDDGFDIHTATNAYANMALLLRALYVALTDQGFTDRESLILTAQYVRGLAATRLP